MTRFGRFGTALAASGVFVVACLFLRQSVVAPCGEYVYPIDDTYIHMAMAKNLVLHGVWGVEPGARAFCSSSPLWTLALSAAAAIFGLREMLPWLLALGFNVLSLLVVCHTLARQGAKTWTCLAGALAVAVAGPFLCTTALGMEHAMHGFFVLAVIVAADGLPRKGRMGATGACVLAAAATASRYESLFLLLPLGVGLCIWESLVRWREGRSPLPVRGVLFLVAAAVPVFAYGTWAVACGGHFLPNSLLLKGKFMTLPGMFHSLFGLFESIRPGCGFLYLLGASLAAVATLPGTRPYGRMAAASCLVAIVGQLLFADVGQLCRYEAYLTAASAFVIVSSVIAGSLGHTPVSRYAPLALFAVTSLTLLARAEQSFQGVVRSSGDIFNQQVLMTRMMSGLPESDRGCVALNDLGYMALFGGFPILDMWGLGSQDVAEMILPHRGEWDREDYEVLFPKHGVKYVVAFESWYPLELMPEGTIDVAKLTLKDNFACGSDTVIFRATSTDAADRLQRHLEKYVGKLPARVTMRFCR